MRNIKNFSYNFIKYFAMGLAFTLISFLFRSCEVKADVISYTTNLSGQAVQNSMYADFKINDGPKNYGTGNIVGTFMSYALHDGWDFIRSIAIIDSVGNEFVCNIGTYVIDGNNQQIGSFTCPVDTSNKLTAIRFRKGDTSTAIQILLGSQRVSFVQDESYAIINGLIGKDYTDLLEQFKERTNEQLVDLYYLIDNKTSDILNAITTNNSNLTNGLNNINDSVKEGNKIQQDTNNTIKSDEVDTSTGNSFFNNFSNNGHGLTGVINAPLSFIQSLSNSSCSSVSVTIPFVNEKFNLPCFSSFYKENFNAVYTIYQVVITALVGYWVCVKIYAMVKGFKDPTDDRIEVMDL